MTRNRILTIFAIAILVVSYSASCYTEKSSNAPDTPRFSYEIIDNGLRLVKITGFADGSAIPRRLVIPGSLTINGTEYTVTKITGFSGTPIRELVIDFLPFLYQGDVMAEAFRDCLELRSVTATSGTIINFGDSCFQGCAKLVTFTATVKYQKDGSLQSRPFGTACFKDCIKLKKVTIPQNSRTIGESAFEGCTSLSFIDLQNIQTINAKAFADCKDLKHLYLPDNLTTIGQLAFFGVSDLNLSVRKGFMEEAILAYGALPSGAVINERD